MTDCTKLKCPMNAVTFKNCNAKSKDECQFYEKQTGDMKFLKMAEDEYNKLDEKTKLEYDCWCLREDVDHLSRIIDLMMGTIVFYFYKTECAFQKINDDEFSSHALAEFNHIQGSRAKLLHKLNGLRDYSKQFIVKKED